MDLKQLIYDWNHGEDKPLFSHPFEITDETLRDGLQSPSVRNPEIGEKIQMLHFMEELGIQAVDIGLPGAGPKHYQDTFRLAQEIAGQRMKIHPNCAARTTFSDIQPIIEISQKVGLEIEIAAFLGSSPIRQFAEEWELETLIKHTDEAVKLGVKNSLPVMFVTEDTTRSHPDTLRQLYQKAIECGAGRICLSDTVGYATPHGVKNLVNFAKKIARDVNPEVKIDWHGHRDRDLAIANTLTALESGVDRVHGAVLGMGERVGNTPLDLLLINLKLLNGISQNLVKLGDYVSLVSRSCSVQIPDNYPVFGRDAFRTATGVHASAIIKAEKKGDSWLADRVYSSIPAGDFGLKQRIEIGYMSGQSNVIYWLEKHGLSAGKDDVERILKKAKESNKILTEEEILQTLSLKNI
jgi:2-isopropylmalate synthase